MNIAVCENGHYLGDRDALEVSEKFCPSCGGKIFRTCPNCGEPIRENENSVFITKYCTSCGTLYPWYAEEKKIGFPLLPNEEKLLLSNLDTKETLKKLRLFNDIGF